MIGWIVFFVVFIGMMSLMGSPSSFETGISLMVAIGATYYVVNILGKKINKGQ